MVPQSKEKLIDQKNSMIQLKKAHDSKDTSIRSISEITSKQNPKYFTKTSLIKGVSFRGISEINNRSDKQVTFCEEPKSPSP